MFSPKTSGVFKRLIGHFQTPPIKTPFHLSIWKFVRIFAGGKHIMKLLNTTIMKDYHTLEDELFNEWEAKSKLQETENYEIVPDGMMRRGAINDDWDRDEGKEYELWENAPLRLIMLTKENIDNLDKRHETGFDGEGNVVHKSFYPNYLRWVYCMLKPEMKNGHWKVKSFEEASDFDKNREYLINKAPLVRINVKKQVGDSSIKDPILRKYVRNYADEIVKQINLYDANILFCCEPQGIILGLIKEKILTDDLEDVNKEDVNKKDWMYYSPTKKVLVVHSFHPGLHHRTHESVYNDLKDAYEDFLQRYPGFPFGK